MSREFESLGVHDVNIGWRDSKNDAVWFRNVFGDEVPSLLLDVRGFVADGDLKCCQDLWSSRRAFITSCGRGAVPLSSQEDPRESGSGRGASISSSLWVVC